MTGHRAAYAYGLAAVLLWSTVATAFKLALRYMAPAQLLLGATVVSLGVLVLLLAVQGKLRLVWACTPRQYVRSLVLGFLNPFLYYTILLAAYDRLPAQVAQPLNYTWAFALAVLAALLLGQRLRWGEMGAAGVSYIGVVIIATGGQWTGWQGIDGLGIGLALGSTVVWALYWIWSARDERDPLVVLTLNAAAALPFVWAYCAWVGQVEWVAPAGLAGAAYVGVFEMGLAFACWSLALQKTTDAARMGYLIFISPFVSLVFIHFLLGEAVRPATLMGLVFIVGGLLLQRRLQAKTG
ncbi:MAG: EamA family transporter [Candidatus Latescibacteria bacterium]|nr:EamA family transporter [Candidatus Latescibacterota bacterium]